MFGLIFLYFIGKYFYNLAGDHDKSQWGFAILGVVSYYVGTFIAGIAFVIGYELFDFGSIDDLSDTVISLMGMPFGLLTCWGLYKILQRNWGKYEKFDENIIDEIGR